MTQRPTGRRIFADTRYVAALDGDAAHRWHSAAKHPEPVLVGDRAWDRAGAFVYGSILREHDRFRMWYQARDRMGGNAHSVAYAESSDGLRWEKPDLGLVQFADSRANNLTDAVLHLPSVGTATDASDPPAYWATGHVWPTNASREVHHDYTVPGVYLFRSTDGYRWRREGGAPLWDTRSASDHPYGGGSDVHTIVHDAPRDRYLAASKFHLPYEGRHRRAFAIRTSPDLRTWTSPRMALAPDELDDRRARERGFDHADFYGVTFHPYPDFLLGFVWVFYMAAPAPGTGWPARRREFGWSRHGHIAEVQPVFSYDGEYWTRPAGRPALIAAGGRGDWDGGNVATANLPVEVGDEHFHYYGGGPIYHGANGRPPDPVEGEYLIRYRHGRGAYHDLEHLPWHCSRSAMIAPVRRAAPPRGAGS